MKILQQHLWGTGLQQNTVKQLAKVVAMIKISNGSLSDANEVDKQINAWTPPVYSNVLPLRNLSHSKLAELVQVSLNAGLTAGEAAIFSLHVRTIISFVLLQQNRTSKVLH